MGTTDEVIVVAINFIATVDGVRWNIHSPCPEVFRVPGTRGAIFQIETVRAHRLPVVSREENSICFVMEDHLPAVARTCREGVRLRIKVEAKWL